MILGSRIHKVFVRWTRVQRNKFGLLIRVCKGYCLLFLFGIVLGASFVLGPLIFSHISNEQRPLQAAEPKENNSSLEKNNQDFTSQDVQGQPDSEPKSDLSPNLNPELNSSPQVSSSLTDNRMTILLVGLDRRPNEKSLSNTDTLIVASVDIQSGKVALVSIPRDTQVVIPGYGMNKINAAARIGNGLKTTSEIIEQLIGQRIDGYVLTNFAGFKEIINTLGGITVNVEKDMYYVTGDKTDGLINLKKGIQRLNGNQALQYARFRQDALADISRTSRQQAVLKALGKEFFQVQTIPKLPQLIPQLMKSVETNLSISKIWALSNVLLRTGTPKISSQTLPGDFLTEDGISYWKVDPQRSQAVVRRLLTEGKTSSVFFK